MTPHEASKTLQIIFLALQTYIVLFLLFHDWLPLGRLNNNAAKRREDPPLHLLFTTLLSALPAAIGLFYSARHFASPYPGWLVIYLWITYGIFVYGFVRAWWIPYLFVPNPERAARYDVIFAGTHSFLPRHNGIVPDTLHVSLHCAIVATLVILFIM
jgi:hypothetical protein